MSRLGITIFTPTYNRAYILKQAYTSLLKQTCKNFEWIIVDDGSTDNTKQLVQSWIKKDEITIRYFYQKNSGKPAAHNKGVSYAKYELFICLDSDDYLIPTAVEKILNKYEQVKDYPSLNGIIAFREIINENITINLPKIDYVTLEDLNYKYNYKYDLALIFKTSILKKYNFPIIEKEKFIQENYIYDQLDLIGKMALLYEKIYVCEYLQDGYSKNIKKIIINNPRSYILCAKQKLIISRNIKSKFHGAVRYIIGYMIIKDKTIKNNFIKELPDFKEKIMVLILLPVAWLLYLKRYK